MHIVLDTNVLISYILPSSNNTIKYVVDSIISNHYILFSEQTFSELTLVLERKKFSHYISKDNRLSFLYTLKTLSIFVEIIKTTRSCRDQKDNKFLNVAINHSTDFIISGDDDLLILDPFKNIPIVTPKIFLERQLN